MESDSLETRRGERYGAPTEQPWLAWALALALDLRWRALPAYATDAAGCCTCSAGSHCSRPGRHLLDGVAVADATTDPAKICELFDRGDHDVIAVAVATGGTGPVVLRLDSSLPPAAAPLVNELVLAGAGIVHQDRTTEAYFLSAAGVRLGRIGELAPGVEILADDDFVVVPFEFDVPPEGWLPQLPWQIAELRARVAELIPTSRITDGALPWRPSPGSNAAAPLRTAASPPQFRPLSAIEERPMRWLWPGLIPLGEVTTVQGHGGHGKSTITADLAARVSTGAEAPLGGPPMPAGAALLLAREDDIASVLRPRIAQSGGDLDRVHVLTDGSADQAPARSLWLPDDVPLLEELCIEHDVRLIVIDPAMAYLHPRLNGKDDQAVQAALEPLRSLARRRNLAVILVRHLVKSGGANEAHRGSGAIAFANVSRSVLQVENGVIRSVKRNVGAVPPPVAFDFVACEENPDLAIVRWAGAGSASEQEPAPKWSGADEIAEFLARELSSGPVPSKELEARAEARRLSWSNIGRVKREHGIPHKRIQNKLWWALTMDELEALAAALQQTAGVGDE